MNANPRIVSLIPSGTEIVCALGLEEHLVGRSHECDFPPCVRDRPACSQPHIDIQASSAEIDEQVKSRIKAGLSIYDVREESLRQLAPDVIVTQTQCDVCAVTVHDVENAVAEWVGGQPTVIALEPNTLEDVWNDIQRIADVVDVSARGQDLVMQLKERMHGLSQRTHALDDCPRVACIEWTDPLMAAGNWVPELVSMAHAEDLFGKVGEHSPWLQWADLEAARPDAIVVLPCGYEISRTRCEISTLTARSEWSQLEAVRKKRVILADGHHYFNRPGPRLVESLEILAESLHPDVFHFGHEGRGWEYL